MRKEPVLLVMAAGMGSRYGGLKQIDKITDEGDIILDFSLYDAKRAGFKKAVFIVREEILDDIKKIIDRGAGAHIDVTYVIQSLDNIPSGYKVPEGRLKPWGTGHAILSAYDVIKGPFAVINADDYYGVTAFKEMYNFLKEAQNESEFAMVAYDLSNTVTDNGSVSRGVCQVTGGLLADIVERTAITKRQIDGITEIGFEEKEVWTKLDADTPVSMNFWGYSRLMMEKLKKEFPKFLDTALIENPQKGEFLIPTVTNSCIKSGEATCKVLESHDKWYGITYREDKQSVKDAIVKLKKDGIYPHELW